MKRILLLTLVSAFAITARASTPPPTAVIHHFPDRHEVVFFSGEEVLFDGSGSYANFPGGTITRWDWYVDGSFKHGGTGSQHKTFSWTFMLGQGETEKTFQVRLRVRDSQNQYGNKYLTVTVKLKPKRYYYLKDHLGSVRAVVDENGNVVSYDDYFPFGLQMPERSLAGDTYAREKFSGNELDQETGYIYFGARYYNPVLGRFFNVDRFSDKYPSLTPYQYAANNPILFIDVNGDSLVLYNQEGIIVHVIETDGDRSDFVDNGKGRYLPTNSELTVRGDQGRGFRGHAEGDQAGFVASNSDFEFSDSHLFLLQRGVNAASRGIGSILRESVEGDLDAKLDLDANNLYLIDGVWYNRDETGNHIWGASLRGARVSNRVIRAGAHLYAKYRDGNLWARDEPNDVIAWTAGSEWMDAHRAQLTRMGMRFPWSRIF